MDLAQFWQLIEKTRKAGDCEEQSEQLVDLLAKLPKKEIVDFDRHFSARMSEAYRYDLWAVAYIVNGGCSDDGFEYFCGWLIGRGQAYFEAAMRNPESAADAVKPGEEVECEDLIYAAATAYEALTGEEHMPHNRAKRPSAPSGKHWKNEDELEEWFPALAQKFM